MTPRQRSQRRATCDIPDTIAAHDGDAMRTSGRSTPSGIEDQFTVERSDCGPPKCGCSTPSGIEDQFTPAADRAGSCGSSAQRLPASKISSRICSAMLCAISRLCSTPSGIEDQFTFGSVPFATPTYSQCSTPSGIEDQFTRGEDRHSTTDCSCSTPSGIEDQFTQYWRVISSRRVVCSTPSGIEDQFTLEPDYVIDPLGHVLNAFRHRRSVHPGRDRSWSLSYRAQRLPASKISSQRRGRRGHADPDVLNAFRHRRSVHNAEVAEAMRILTCSTPSGIEDQFTRLIRERTMPCSCAQRLPASKISSPSRTPRTAL